MFLSFACHLASLSPLLPLSLSSLCTPLGALLIFRFYLLICTQNGVSNVYNFSINSRERWKSEKRKLNELFVRLQQLSQICDSIHLERGNLETWQLRSGLLTHPTHFVISIATIALKFIKIFMGHDFELCLPLAKSILIKGTLFNHVWVV